LKIPRQVLPRVMKSSEVYCRSQHLDIPIAGIVRPAILETTALGAAYLAGLAVGFWRDEAEIFAQWKVGRVFEPAMKPDQREKLRATWAKAVARAKAWEEE
jgi:glycerol kinase